MAKREARPVRYIANALIVLPAGTHVQLADSQAARRGARIRQIADDWYEALDSIQIKAGEQFGLRSRLPPVLAMQCSELTTETKDQG